MTEQDTRVGLGAVAAGTLVSVAVAGTLSSVLAAVLASGNDLTFDLLQSRAPFLGVALAIVLGLGAFVGGRVTAVASRTLIRRDGMLAGLVTGSVMAVLLMIAAGLVAAVWPYSAASLLLAGLAFATVVALGCGILGGASGARAEARAVGLKTVHVAKRGFQASSAESYERDFFAGDSLPNVRG